MIYHLILTVRAGGAAGYQLSVPGVKAPAKKRDGDTREASGHLLREFEQSVAVRGRPEEAEIGGGSAGVGLELIARVPFQREVITRLELLLC
jgi:hypothetical protein